MGVAAILVGGLVALIGTFLPGGAGDVSNLAALNLKTNLVIIGSALFVAGAVSSSVARFEKAIKAQSIHDAMDMAIERHARDVTDP